MSTLAFALLLTAAASIAASNESWLASVSDTKPLNELSIPGSHNTCARHEPLKNTAQCQTLSIPEQLAAGVRFLDIRCRHVKDGFAIYHGSIDQKITFTTVLQECGDFLSRHPREFIVMSIKEEGSAKDATRSFEHTFSAYRGTNTVKWYLNERIPKVGEVRGSIVLFRRFNSKTRPNGLPALPWKDKQSFVIPLPAGETIKVQDAYEVSDNQQKWRAFESLLVDAAQPHASTLFVNFASGYKPGLFGIPDITAVSRFMNAKISDALATPKHRRLGIILMDFVDADLCSRIIRINF